MAKSVVQEFTKGLWAEIPPFRLVLGLCPTLAVTKSVENGFGMGVATTFVLVCSNILISLLRSVVPKRVRIACYIVVIATFVTVVELLMQAFAYPLFLQLGIFIPLIVVNCILLGRAEAFASKNGVVASLADGLGIGIGFTLSLTALSLFREVLGKGSLTLPFGIASFTDIFGASYQPFSFLVEAPGAFVCLGLMLCIMNMLGKK
ncbi:MAG: electron transport complex subunit E [Deltaproteobacteria bacterium]|nr:electron transport complex subunit E [Deltaproteobacteria bacterium]MBW2015598.1 electron transport complex subunit E [Deltaproteobacteria bacterium]MBW2128096.1 electron transport complex subunit E [Deltaproteobacteria bacterium]MBW2303007.1 electron transport complex subunit E [Deltaproteobacteria bacterium]